MLDCCSKQGYTSRKRSTCKES